MQSPLLPRGGGWPPRGGPLRASRAPPDRTGLLAFKERRRHQDFLVRGIEVRLWIYLISIVHQGPGLVSVEGLRVPWVATRRVR